MRKVVSMLLVAVMLLSCLAGCGQKEEKQQQSSQPSSAAEKESVSVPVSSEAEPELEEKTIQIWLSCVAKQKDADMVWEKFNEMLQEYVPNTTVEFSTVPSAEYKEKFNQMLAGKEPVDLAWAGWVIDKQQNANDGNLMPLDDLLEEYGQGIIAALGDGAIIDMHRSATDGKAYFLNSWQGLFGGRRGWFVPTELAKLAGDTWL